MKITGQSYSLIELSEMGWGGENQNEILKAGK